jgi:heavy metal sensor kinase
MLVPHQLVRSPLLVQLNTIRGRLTLWYAVVLAVTLASYSVVLAASLAGGLYAALDRIVNDEARQALGVLNLVHTDTELNEEFRRINVGTFVGLYDATGEYLIAGRALPKPLDRMQPVVGTVPRLDTRSAADGSTWRVLVQRVSLPGEPDRLLVVARSAAYVGLALNQLDIVMSITLPLVLLLAISGGVFMASRALNPIDQITRTAEAIGADDLSRRLGLPRTQDEVGRLAATFDRMLTRLDRAFEHQRRFTADASHELRTPIAMLVSRAGLTLERGRSTEDYVRVLREIRDDGLRMSRIVNDLLTLARADAGEFVGLTECLDMADLVVGVVESMRPLARKHNVHLDVGSVESVSVVGDQTRLMQLLVNLIDNALVHTDDGGYVLVSIVEEAEAVVLSVKDTGSGIAPEHLPHVFERFFRGERDSVSERSGAGLGLALCLSIARAHGGNIAIESEPGQGTLVTVRLPQAGATMGQDSLSRVSMDRYSGRTIG